MDTERNTEMYLSRIKWGNLRIDGIVVLPWSVSSDIIIYRNRDRVINERP
jgi:hypothetical protein